VPNQTPFRANSVVVFAHLTIVADFAVTDSVRERGNAARAALPSDAFRDKAYPPVIPV